jgi:predicted transcriptional regulator
MVTLEVVELDAGRFGVRAIGAGEAYLDSGEFETREQAEDWIFLRAEQASLRDEPRAIIPGAGQGLR